MIRILLMNLNVRLIFRSLAIGLGGLHTWAAIISQSMNADGISYLDIGDAYFRADWTNAINPVWPPLYSWMLGLMNFIVKPVMAWQFPAAHVLNFFIFLGALVCFEHMWGKLGNSSVRMIQTGSITIATWAWWAIGYALFIWTSLNLIQIWAVTPDMLMAALLYLATALVIDIREGDQRWHKFLLIGFILGLGFLAKTIMFLIALIFLMICLALVKRSWDSIVKVLFSLLIFLFICLPFIYLISEKKGKFTIGEAGTVTYMRHVDGIPFSHWQGDPVNQIVLSHPSRIIHQNPPIYEFAEPIGGTYPISTDPSYWYDGADVKFNLRNQLARILVSGLFYLQLFFQKQGILLTCTIALMLISTRKKSPRLQVIRKWALVIPAFVAFTLYGLVLMEERYVAAFILLFWTDIFANIRLTDTAYHRSWLNILCFIAVLGLLANILIFNLDGINRLNPSLQANVGGQTFTRSASPLEVAQELHRLDIKQGDKVAVIGYGFDSYWARLARVKIIAEMPEEQAINFWIGDESLHQSALQTFASTGAKVVVAEFVPYYARRIGWQQVNDSNYFIYHFKE